MYLSWKEQTITDFSTQSIEFMYNQGYVFTRTGKGNMKQTRSLRIDLRKFELSSENKRILKKAADLHVSVEPVPYMDYTWRIHKMGKDFYEKKFGPKTFSAQKIKELMTDTNNSNFNRVFVYDLSLPIPEKTEANPYPEDPIGYCIVLETTNLIHYCYPFYNLAPAAYPQNSNVGMSMMLKAILRAQEYNKQYIYLGSAQRPSDTYKLQFAGLEWFDGTEWKTNFDELKTILQSLNNAT